MTLGPSNIEVFLEDFRDTILHGQVRLQKIDSEESRRQEAPGKWTKREILGHLIDSAANNHQRFVRAAATDNLVFSGYDQVAWVETQKYNDAEWQDLIDLWASYNLHLTHLLSVIPAEAFTRKRLEHNLDQIAWKTVSKEEPTTLEYFVRDYLGHLKHHLDQIFET